MKRLLLIFLALLCSPAYALDVYDSAGNPLSTGMGWSLGPSRPTDQQILDSTLGPTIEALRDKQAISPDMIGDDSAEDDTELLRWSVLVARVLEVPLWFNHEYGFSKPLEIQQGQTWFGNGPYSPGLFHIVDAINAQDLQTWQSHAPAVIQAPDAKQFTIRDLQIDGKQGELDWPTIRAWPQADLDALSNLLRNSPSWAGLAFTNQSGRDLPERVFLDRVHVHDTLSSCMLAHCEVQASALTLGNSVSGRILYDCKGRVDGLHCYGFTRSSVFRLRPPLIVNGFTYRGEGHVNPWPENVGGDNMGAVYSKAGDTGLITLLGIDWDGTDTHISRSVVIEHDCHIAGQMRNLSSIFLRSHLEKVIQAKIDLLTENCHAPELLVGFANLDLHWVNRKTDSTATVKHSLTTNVRKQPWHPPGYSQNFKIYADPGDQHYLMFHFKDLVELPPNQPAVYPDSDLVVPTTVQLSGRYNNTLSRWFSFRSGATAQYKHEEPVGWLESMPIEVILENVENVAVPPGPFVGDDSWESDMDILDIWNRREALE